MMKTVRCLATLILLQFAPLSAQEATTRNVPSDWITSDSFLGYNAGTNICIHWTAMKADVVFETWTGDVFAKQDRYIATVVDLGKTGGKRVRLLGLPCGPLQLEINNNFAILTKPGPTASTTAVRLSNMGSIPPGRILKSEPTNSGVFGGSRGW